MRSLRLALLLMCLSTLSGCLSTGSEVPGQGAYRSRAEVEHDRLFSLVDLSNAGRRLIPMTTLDGYLRESNSGRSAMLRLLVGAEETRNQVNNPAALGVGDKGVYVIDGDTHILYRFRWKAAGAAHDTPDHRQDAHNGLTHADWQQLAVLRDLEEPSDIFVAPGGDIFISDGKGAKVLRYDADGNRLAEFTSEHLRFPVAVAVDRRGLRVFIADGLYDRIVVFNAQGRALYSIGSRGDHPGGFRSIRDMAQGRNGLLYVINGIGRQIQVYGLDGTFVRSFGRSVLSDPGAMAVDDEGRVFVSDTLNQRLVVFADGLPVEFYGSHGTGPGKFAQPQAVAYHDGKLYVAERQNARIQVFRVVPEALAREAAK